MKFVSLHLGCSARQKALTVREKSLAQKNHWAQKKVFAHRHFETQIHLHTKAFPTYFVLQSLHKALPSTTLYYKACTKYFPVLLCTTKLAQTTSQYYCVLQSLQKVLPSTTLHYKACTKYFPTLLCITKLARTTSQYYFVLQSLHKVIPSTTLYYKTFRYYFVLQSLHKVHSSTTLYCKACTKHLPVLLCTTKLAQSTFQYYLVPQSLRKVLPSTALYYKACTKHFPGLLCTTKLAKARSSIMSSSTELKQYIYQSTNCLRRNSKFMYWVCMASSAAWIPSRQKPSASVRNEMSFWCFSPLLPCAVVLQLRVPSQW